MPRRPRSWIDDSCYHITHRCNNKMFLFKYDKYKKFYKRQLFKMKNHYKIDILDYIITSNHVHLLVKIKNNTEISEGLRFLHGRMGQWYNSQNSVVELSGLIDSILPGFKMVDTLEPVSFTLI